MAALVIVTHTHKHTRQFHGISISESTHNREQLDLSDLGLSWTWRRCFVLSRLLRRSENSTSASVVTAIRKYDPNEDWMQLLYRALSTPRQTSNGAHTHKFTRNARKTWFLSFKSTLRKCLTKAQIENILDKRFQAPFMGRTSHRVVCNSYQKPVYLPKNNKI